MVWASAGMLQYRNEARHRCHIHISNLAAMRCSLHLEAARLVILPSILFFPTTIETPKFLLHNLINFKRYSSCIDGWLVE